MDLLNTQSPVSPIPCHWLQKEKQIVYNNFYHELAHAEVTDLHTHSLPA